MSTSETRYLPSAELRVVRDDAGPRIAGYAIVFNAPSEVLSERGVRFVEVIKPEAVTDALAGNPDIRALVDHDSSKLLGRTTVGTLKYRVDARGVYVEIMPPDTTYARDVVAVIERGDMDGMSFGFSVAAQGETWDTSGALPVRSVTRMARISEFSAVTFPAYPQTEAAVRSLQAFTATQRGIHADVAARRLRIAAAESGPVPFSARATTTIRRVTT
jgi:uncharacterized protein